MQIPVPSGPVRWPEPAQPTPAWTWLLDDLNGSTGTISDDNGAVLEQAAYDPYGKPTKGGAGKAAGSAGSTLGYQKDLTDRLTGSIILGARQYDPSARRFTTADTYAAATADLALGTDTLTGNRYLFAAANPVGFYEDGHAPWSKNRLYKQYRKQIKAAAGEFDINPVLLAALLQHEGNWRQRGVKFPILGRLGRRIEQSRFSLSNTVGIGQMRPDVAARLAREYLGENMTTRQARKKLIYDTNWSIRLASLSLSEWIHKYGLSEREPFIAYAFGPEDLPELRRTRFRGRDGKGRGESYDRLSKQIGRSKEYKR